MLNFPCSMTDKLLCKAANSSALTDLHGILCISSWKVLCIHLWKSTIPSIMHKAYAFHVALLGIALAKGAPTIALMPEVPYTVSIF
jgi:hypothetical protein